MDVTRLFHHCRNVGEKYPINGQSLCIELNLFKFKFKRAPAIRQNDTRFGAVLHVPGQLDNATPGRVRLLDGGAYAAVHYQCGNGRLSRDD